MAVYTFRRSVTPDSIADAVGIKNKLSALPTLEKGTDDEGVPYAKVSFPGVKLTVDEEAKLQQIASAHGWGKLE